MTIKVWPSGKNVDFRKMSVFEWSALGRRFIQRLVLLGFGCQRFRLVWSSLSIWRRGKQVDVSKTRREGRETTPCLSFFCE